MKITLLAPVLVVLAVLAQGASADAAAPRISARELQADIAYLRETVARAHPDLGFSSSAEAIYRALDGIGQGLAPSMTRDEAWGRLARLNPVFADAHLFVGYPEWRADSAAHLASGRTLFPFEVHVGPDGKLSIKSKLGGAADELAGARIAWTAMPARRPCWKEPTAIRPHSGPICWRNAGGHFTGSCMAPLRAIA